STAVQLSMGHQSVRAAATRPAGCSIQAIAIDSAQLIADSQHARDAIEVDIWSLPTPKEAVLEHRLDAVAVVSEDLGDGAAPTAGEEFVSFRIWECVEIAYVESEQAVE